MGIGSERHQPGRLRLHRPGLRVRLVGVIFGRDLRWDTASETWIGDSGASHDSIVKRSGDRFTDLVKRSYRVLLTRGLKGCYVYFEDGETANRVGEALAVGQLNG